MLRTVYSAVGLSQIDCCTVWSPNFLGALLATAMPVAQSSGSPFDYTVRVGTSAGPILSTLDGDGRRET
jgi:hypothetical protein